ncbi:hypothetical protein MMC07_001291 [Pseudocyphellaria aurata]|nr:hypothetical protein [Pseudocyphellaria aurata]
MSLNGLDATVVNEAYQSALAEGGGWFLLNYTTRDEVNLLGRGSGGLVEVKDAVDQYGQPSPLYGFINYRRRRVVLKYLPEGTSRLLQARVAVHFQSIVEKLTPNDTTFTFVASSQLKDSALSSACSLHTASASVKSSSDSLRQKGLAEIAEDAREHRLEIGDDQSVNGGSVHSIGSEDTRARTVTPQEFIDEQKHQRAPPTKHNLSPSRSTRTIRNTDKALPPTPPKPGLERREYKISVDGNFDTGHPLDTRSSFQSSRPSTRDFYGTYDYKQKVKVGPRPSIDSANRPLTSDSFRVDGPRPVSTLPPSVRLPARKSGPARKRSQQSQQSQQLSHPPKVLLSPPLPLLPIQKVETPSQPKIGAPVLPAGAPETKTQSMTPEKRRLMKALQLRQKQMATRAPPEPPESVPALTRAALEQPQNLQTSKIESSDITKDPQGEFEIKQHEDEDSAAVKIAVKDIDVSSQALVESSPISILEPSDGGSTLASSITDEEDVHTIKTSDPELVLDFVSMATPNQPPESKAHHEMPPLSVDEPEVPLDLVSERTPVKPPDFESPHEVPPSPVNDPEGILEPVSERTPDQLPDVEPPHEVPPPLVVDPEVILDPVRNRTPDQPPEFDFPHEVPLPPVDDGEAITLSRPHSSSEEEDMSPKTLKPTKEFATLISIDFNDPQNFAGDFNATRPSTSDTMEDDREDRVPRHDAARSMRRGSSPENSDDHFLSDDSFMEELGSATVQEAKPISVSKSPITPLFPRYPAEQQWIESARKARSISGPLEDRNRDELGRISPEMRPVLTSRSVSASQPANNQSQHASAILLKKVGVSTGISQRIKALEKLSSRPTSPSSLGHSPAVSPGTTPASVSLRKASLPIPRVDHDLVKNNGKSYPPKMSSFSPPTLEADSLDPKNNSVSVRATSKSKKPRPESISVTATIIRDPHKLMPAAPVDPSEPSMIDLFQSPLVVEHQAAEMTPSFTKAPTSKYQAARSTSSSSTERKSDSPYPTRRDSIASRRSTPSCRGSELDLSRSVSDSLSSGPTGLDGIKEDKKESRKSRLFKRMSNISSASRRSIVYAFNSPVKDQPIVEHHETPYQASPVVVQFGDVNIQFPDTLLWKRRDMKINDQGSLVLSSSKADNNSKIATKRFPLSEFHTPYIPDQDRQELPNSVILDFKDGGTLQIACERPSAQAELLKGMRLLLLLNTIARWLEYLGVLADEKLTAIKQAHYVHSPQ